ncbi:unnamed protein product [Darwinula stevensoni]|uniref:Uncharacterized protein n=1 Tax=Darwinula stevensoni TaxID=69355 RepID=A0A7R8X5B4_9CRUS|nr:unnamed protein product [Darwinula stevensoni]CAG0879945.1 unnamed protein product [Darwinula stevensoni]
MVSPASVPNVRKRKQAKVMEKRGPKRIRFSAMDSFDIDVIRREVYAMYAETECPTRDSILARLKKEGEDGENFHFPYGRTSLQHILWQELGFKVKKFDRKEMVMLKPHVQAALYDTHDLVRKGWSDGSRECLLSHPQSRGKKIIILHTGSAAGWLPNTLLLSSWNITESGADCHSDMNSSLFEIWVKKMLLENLQGDCVVVMDNAPYHPRRIDGIPTKSSSRSDIMKFLGEHDVIVLEDQWMKVVGIKPTKAMLLDGKGEAYQLSRLVE